MHLFFLVVPWSCQREATMQSLLVLFARVRKLRNWIYQSLLSRVCCRCRQYTVAMGGTHMDGVSKQSFLRSNLWSTTLGLRRTLHVGHSLTQLPLRLSRLLVSNVTHYDIFCFSYHHYLLLIIIAYNLNTGFCFSNLPLHLRFYLPLIGAQPIKKI